MDTPEKTETKKTAPRAAPAGAGPEGLEQELQRLYADPKGEMPDFSRIESRPRNRVAAAVGWVLFFLIALGGVSWAGYFFFLRPPSFSGDKIAVRIEAPEGLTAGDEAVLNVIYRNDERVPVAAASVSVELPKEFIMTSAEPAADNAGQWPVGSLAPNQEGRIKLTGWVRGQPGTILTARAALTYKPANFNSSFQKVVSRTMPVNAAALTVAGQGPNDLVPGENGEFAFTVSNTSNRTLAGLEFRYDPLVGFVYDSATPTPTAEHQDRWSLPTLNPGDSLAVVIGGTFSSDSRGAKALHGRIGYPDGDKLVTVAEADAAATVQKSDLNVGLIVNGSDQAPSVSLGDALNFTVNWKNTGDVHLKNVTLSAELPSTPNGLDLVDWPSLKDDLGGTRTGTTVTWTSKQVPGLADLAPDDEGSLNFSVQLVRKVTTPPTNGNLEIDALVRAKIAKTNKTPAREIVGSPLAIKLNSDTAFRAAARYFDADGAPLGSGPLPPKVGQATTYRLTWTITNSLHELSSITVSTLLPQGVKWTGAQGKIDAGALTFDDSGRAATWHLNRLPTSVKQVSASFDVAVTPDATDAGEILDLTGDSKFEALDTVTQSVVLKTERPVGTDLLGDETAAGKGVVQK